MENVVLQEYVGGMIRKILYFLLRRINFSPEKAAAAKNVNPAKGKLEKSVEKNFSVFFLLVEKYSKSCGKKKTREMYVHTIKQ